MRARVPDTAWEWKAVRASGPGGQNVNKVSSKVELRLDLSRVEGLDEGARARLAVLAAPRLDSAGRLLVTSQLTRDQAKNLQDARRKALELIERASVRPKVRRPTAPSRASKARRVEGKKADARRKQHRGRLRSDE